MDILQQEVAALVEQAADGDVYHTFRAVEQLASELAGVPAPTWTAPLLPDLPPPRLTEDWFC